VGCESNPIDPGEKLVLDELEEYQQVGVCFSWKLCEINAAHR
jgi:hypothetical protein